MFGSGIDGI